MRFLSLFSGRGLLGSLFSGLFSSSSGNAEPLLPVVQRGEASSEERSGLDVLDSRLLLRLASSLQGRGRSRSRQSQRRRSRAQITSSLLRALQSAQRQL